MNDINLIRFGALLHDIGKFWQRSGESHDDRYTHLTKDDYGEHGAHAKWSADFIRRFLKIDGKEDIEQIVLYHHNPNGITNDRLSSLAKVVQKADHLSAKERGKRYEEREVVNEPMECIFSNIRLDDEKKIEKYYHNLTALELDYIYPKRSKKECAKGSSAYCTLWNKIFLPDFEGIPQRSPESLFDSLYYLLMKCASFMPSAAYLTVPDISLFNHLKTTCAIADCLLKNNGEEEFLLVGGDISGVQKFLYTLSSKGAAKSLKGRSFYLDLLTETLAKYIVRNLELSKANILFCGGGHFYILAPGNSAKKITALRKVISDKIHVIDLCERCRKNVITIGELPEDREHLVI